MIPPEDIKRAKGEGVKAGKRVIPLIKAAPEELSINEEGYIMEGLRKWDHCDLQEKGQRRKDQEFILGDVLDLQSSIGRGGERCRRQISGRNHLGRYLPSVAHHEAGIKGSTSSKEVYGQSQVKSLDGDSCNEG